MNMNIRASALLIVLITSVSLSLGCDKEPAPSQKQPAKPAEPAAAAPSPEPEVKPATPTPEPAAEPDPAAEQPAASPTDGLASGSYSCSFQDRTGSYNRRCKITSDADGALSLVAAGTELNPDNAFSGTLVAGLDGYTFRGKITGFEDCVGSFEAAMKRDGDRYVTKTKLDSGCPITIRISQPKPDSK